MRSGKGQLRDLAFGCIRGAHKRVLMKPLPDRLAVYFHALERVDHGEFRTCIEQFRSLGYRIVPLAEYVNPNIQGRLVFVSFDDNYKNWHDSLDLLATLGVTATFYVNTQPFMDICPASDRIDYFGRIAYSRSLVTLTRGELRELVNAGQEIGCHSHSHFNLARLDRSLWDAEIRDSRRQLEDIIGRAVDHFAYPYGMRRYFSPALHAYCLAQGFKTIATAIPGLQQVAHVDPFNLHRTRWNFDRSLDENIEDLRIDGRLFEALTGRSAVG